MQESGEGAGGWLLLPTVLATQRGINLGSKLKEVVK